MQETPAWTWPATDRWGFQFERMDLPDYMLRWYLRIGTKGQHRMLRLHCILRSDEDRQLHDHPFGFKSLILKGSYREIYCDPALGVDPSDEANHHVRTLRPGDVNECPADRAHRLEVVDGPVWTLVLSEPWCRNWGFWTKEGWVKWDTYLAEQAG